jgi:hypothetical protein
MKWWTDIRRKVLVEQVSKRKVMAEYSIHAKTLEKILFNPEPPGYRMSRSRPKPVIGPFLGRIEEILRQDRGLPRKQRHTAKRIFDRPREEEVYSGGYTQVKETVRELKGRLKEVYIPLSHRPGEAQMDFGCALVKENGVLRKEVYEKIQSKTLELIDTGSYKADTAWRCAVREWLTEHRFITVIRQGKV